MGPVQKAWKSKSGEMICYGYWGMVYKLEGGPYGRNDYVLKYYDERAIVTSTEVGDLIRNLRLTGQFVADAYEQVGDRKRYYIIMKKMGIDMRDPSLKPLREEADKRYEEKYNMEHR